MTMVVEESNIPEQRSVTMQSRDSADQHCKHIASTEDNNYITPKERTTLDCSKELVPITVGEKEISIVVSGGEEETNEISCGSCSPGEEDQVLNLTLLLNTGEKQLYGREEEKSQLLEAFYRRISQSNAPADNEIVLVTGRSGTGKTALANTLREPVVEKGGYFISGKFDQLQKPEPYATFVAAFTEYTRLVMDKGEETMSSVKETILNAMGSETRFVTNMIPALEQIVGPQSVISSLKGGVVDDAQKRHNFVFCKFMRAICSYDCPLVLFIDDLQWSDSGSVDLLEALLTDKEIQGLMVLGTCRHDEISRDHKLSYMLRKVEDERIALITNIEVHNLSPEDTDALVSNILNKQPSSVLSSIIYDETRGNIFFIYQFLMTLYDNGVLYVDNTTNNSDWRLNEDVIRTMTRCHDVVELLVEKMVLLPLELQEMLKVAACIGSVFDEYLLFELLTFSNVDEVLSTAVGMDLITPNDGKHGGYRFGHDKTQQAAYSLIPEFERNGFHLHIGRCLLENLPAEELDMNLFVVVNQLSWGVDLIQDQQEKDNLASLCLKAGEKAASSSDFVTAASYLRLGIHLLGEKHWRDQYFLSLDIFNAAAEMEYCNGDFERVDTLVDAVLSNARILRDKVRAYTTQVYSLGARQKLDMAIDKGFEVLKHLEQSFPSNPRKVYLIRNFLKTKRMLRNMTDDNILSLPNMYEWEKIAAIQMCSLVLQHTHVGRPAYWPFVALRCVQLTLRYGLGPISSPVFAAYGVLNCAVGKVDEGFRYGQLSLRILDKFKIESWLPRTYAFVYGFHWAYTAMPNPRGIFSGYSYPALGAIYFLD